MDEMPNFDQPHETPADAPKKPRRKPIKRQKVAKHRTPMPKRLKSEAPKKTRKKRRKVRVTKRLKAAIPNGLNYKEFQAAWNVLGTLSTFDSEAKQRILDKIKEVWT